MNDLEDKKKKLLDRIRYNSNLKKHFFRKLAKTTNPFPWFEDLIIEGYYEPERYPSPLEVPDNPGYFTMPYWEPLGFLENISKLNSENPNDKITQLLLEIINNYISYDYGNDRNYNTDLSFIKLIFYLPKDKITIDHINLISKALNSKWDSSIIQSELSEAPIKKLIEYERKDLLLRLLDIILSFKKENGKYSDDYVSIMDEFWLNKILKDNNLLIAEFCALDAFKVALNKISNILDEDEFQFDYGAIPTIEDHPQSMFTEEDYKFLLVHFARDMFEYLESKGIYSEDIRECTEKLIASEKKFFKRMGIFIINLFYDELNDLFWNWNNNPLDDLNFRHDIYRLFNNNYLKFDDDEEKINLIVKWIDNQKFIFELEKEVAEPKTIAIQKLRWLLALEDSENQTIQSLLKEYRDIYSDEIENPDFDIWYGDIVTISGKDSEKLCVKNNQELADYLNEKNSSESFFEKSELSESFIKCVSHNPDKFAKDITPFLEVSRENQYNLIRGLLNAWRSENTFECNEILDNFILKILEDENFWQEDYSDINYRNWIVSAVADFIEIGNKEDINSFEKESLPLSEKILLILSDKSESDLPEMHDLITSVLNSTFGKIFSAMIVYSLKCFRETGKFPDSIKIELEKRLQDPLIELSVTLGRFLPYLYKMDKYWVNENLELIFPKDDDTETWKNAFMGYLFYSSVIYPDIYKLFKRKEHYDDAIKTDFEDRQITQRLIQHVGTFYLLNEEDIEDETSLIYKLIYHKNPEQISFLINFISSQKNLINLEQIKQLWDKIVDIFSDNNEVENCDIIVKLARWIELVQEIDADVHNWLVLSAKCMKSDTDIDRKSVV